MYDALSAPSAAPPLAGTSDADAPWRVIARTAFPFVVVGGIWEIVAHLGLFPPRLFPPLETVAATLVHLTAAGILPHHAIETLARLLAGFALAGLAGVAFGIAMGRSRRAEDIFLPLVSIEIGR